MSTDIPQALIDVVESIDRNARAYGWEVAKRDAYPPDGTELSSENPFIHPDWRDRISIQTALENVDPNVVIPGSEVKEDVEPYSFKVSRALDKAQGWISANEMRMMLRGGNQRYTLPSGVEIESTHKLLPPELYRIGIEVEAGTRSSSFQTKRYSDLTVWRVTFIPDSGRRLPDNRDPECVKRWPDCESGGYHPDCCRFPKSCSCTVVRSVKEVGFTGFTTEKNIPTGDQRDLVSRGLPDIVKQALETRNVPSCADCPFGHHLDPREEWENDPSEAYFSCDLGFGDNPERFWGEYPPCDKVFIHDGYAQRVLQSMGLLEFMTSKE